MSSLISSVIHLLFSSICLAFTVCVFFLQLISTLIWLWLEKMPDMISIFKNLLRLVLWPSM